MHKPSTTPDRSWCGRNAESKCHRHVTSYLLTPAIDGDANLDGQVDINDLTIVLAHYDQTGMSWSTGRFHRHGTVDINDLTIVLAHYNQSTGSSAAGMAAVPEPGMLALFAAGLAGCWPMLYRRLVARSIHDAGPRGAGRKTLARNASEGKPLPFLRLASG